MTGPSLLSWQLPGLAIAAGLGSAAAVGLVRLYALAHGVLDQPNGRSSHIVATPRGGGAGLVGVLLTAAAWIGLRASLGVQYQLALAGVLAVAAVGWMDDHRSLGVGVRLIVHILAGVAVAVLAARAVPAAGVLALAAATWWVLWTVAAINVVNFIDGIDGMIGAQALVYGAYVLAAAPADSAAQRLGCVLAAASSGFLFWNWRPARIFLGDVGSGALGVFCVLLGVLLVGETGENLVAAFLPLAGIFLDASVTIYRRARRGEPLTVAHRSHLYQRLIAAGHSHATSALLFAGFAVAGAVVALLAPERTAALGAYFLGLVVAYALVDRYVLARSTQVESGS